MGTRGRETQDMGTQVWQILGLIYETNVQPKIEHKVFSTQNLEFINMDVSGGYDQISRQVWARVRKFWYRVTSVYALPFW